MLTPGNSKLGQGGRIWGFGLPSQASCPGRSVACVASCYAYHLEQYRPSVRRRYARNLALSRRADFVKRVVALVSVGGCGPATPPALGRPGWRAEKASAVVGEEQKWEHGKN